MVYYPNQYSVVGDEAQASWDLRQVRAKFISFHLLAIDEACRKRDYPEWVRNVMLLYRFVEHYLLNKDRKNKIKIAYERKLGRVIKVSQKYQGTYFNKNQNAEGVWAIEQAIMELERYIFLKMEKSGLWGTRFDDDDGL